MSAFTSHLDWVRELRVKYEAQVAAESPRPCPVGWDAADSSLPSSPAAAPALPMAPMAWGRAEELNSEQGFALDSADFEEPVYRSLGSMMLNVEFVDDDTACNEPVYRSLALDGAEDSAREETSEAKWLETMPPLLKRQRGASHLFI